MSDRNTSHRRQRVDKIYRDQYGQPCDRYGRPCDAQGYLYDDYDDEEETRAFQPGQRGGVPPRRQQPSSGRRNGRKRRKKRRHPILRTIQWLIILLIIFLVAFGAKLLWSYNYDDTNASALSQTTGSDGIMNIALFGVDSRDETTDEKSRSDAVMVLSIDPKHRSVKLITLMRDSYVAIPGHGSSKLCHAYAYGGPQLSLQTINEDFDMNLTEYMTVDFAKMAAIVDSVGGIKLDITEAERKETNKFIKHYCKIYDTTCDPLDKDGTVKMNGIQAVSYGRIRKNNTGGDWSRTSRQSQILQAVYKKATGNPITLLRFLNGLMPNIKTSMSRKDFLYAGFKTILHGVPKISHARLPADGEWSYGTGAGGMSVIKFDDKVLADHLHDYIYNNNMPKQSDE